MLKDFNVFVLGCPREPFREDEFVELQKYLNEGGSLLVLLGEGGEAKSGANINYLLEQKGISINSDSLIHTSYYKYLHPKEVFISNGILNKEIVRTARGFAKSTARKDMDGKKSEAQEIYGHEGRHQARKCWTQLCLPIWLHSQCQEALVSTFIQRIHQLPHELTPLRNLYKSKQFQEQDCSSWELQNVSR